MRGISRHVVRFVDYDGALYALKELPRALAEREYRLLRELADEEMPVVEVVGVVTERGESLEAVLITRHLEYSLPYRALFARGAPRELRATAARRARRAARAAAPRRASSGATARSRTRSSAATRASSPPTSSTPRPASCTRALRTASASTTSMIAEENVAGELLDVEAELRDREGELDPLETATSSCARYERLWNELTREEVFRADERYQIDERLRRLNELGFDVEEIELDRGRGRLPAAARTRTSSSRATTAGGCAR